MKSSSVTLAIAFSGVVLVACGQGASAEPGGPAAPVTPAVRAAAARVPDGDWLTFDANPQRTGVAPAPSGITRANLLSLRRRDVSLPGTVDSTPVQVHGVRLGRRRRDIVIMTTTYGRTLAVDPATGGRLWTYTPATTSRLEGSYRITTASPVVSGDRRWVYATSPDGLIHKLAVATGDQVRTRHWPARVTFDPTREKLASSLTLAHGTLYVGTDGYIGDAPVYQGHLVALDAASGAITHVWNSLCSNLRRLIDPPSRCAHSDSAIWGRSGAVIEPGSGRVLVATGNGDFDGRANWGDSVLELTPTLRLLHNWTPGNQSDLRSSDTDVGSASPAILPSFGGRHLAVQGGKAGLFALLDLGRLNGSRGPAGPRTGGELQFIGTPGHSAYFSEPAVWTHGKRIYVLAADADGTTAYELTNPARPRLRVVWETGTPGTSPVLADGLLYVYDFHNGALNVRDPLSGRLVSTLPAAPGHWNSPIVVGGRVMLPVGNANDRATTGTLEIFHLPGR